MHTDTTFIPTFQIGSTNTKDNAPYFIPIVNMVQTNTAVFLCGILGTEHKQNFIGTKNMVICCPAFRMWIRRKLLAPPPPPGTRSARGVGWGGCRGDCLGGVGGGGCGSGGARGSSWGDGFPHFGVAPQVGVRDSYTSVWPLGLG